MSGASLEVKLFGSLELRRSDGAPLALPSKVARSLLAYLLTHRERAHARERLAGIFWPDVPEQQARRRLSQALWRIGETLGQDCLNTDAFSVGWNPNAPIQLDLERFEQAFMGAKPETISPSSVRDAITAYRGEFLEGIDEDWVLEARERYSNAFLTGLEQCSKAAESNGEFERALEMARRVVALDGLREQAHREVMRLCLILGRPREALEQYERRRAITLNEMGEEPTSLTKALYQRIQIGETAPERTNAPLEIGGVLPLVGRERERGLLLERLELARDGRGGMVLLEGEPGLGKTRLLSEIAQDAAWRGFEVRWGQGREWIALEPYALVREVIETGLTPLRAELLAQRLDGVWLREAGRVIVRFNQLKTALVQSVTLTPEHEGMRLREAMVQTVLALGGIGPQLIVFDDLQWADEASLELLSALIRRLDAPILVVISYRPEESRERPSVWDTLQTIDREPNQLRISLGSLSSTEAAQLVRRALGSSVETPLERRIGIESQGNPLLVLETLRALMENGGLEAGGNAELPLPASVREVIIARLTRLAPPVRAVLDAAAVIGSELDIGLCTAASGQMSADTLLALDQLVRRGFLQEDESGLRFGHDKLRQIVYAELLEGERRDLHRAIGQALEARDSQALEVLARHFDEASVWDKALEYHRRSAERASGLYDYRGSLKHLERALSLVEHVEISQDDHYELCRLAEVALSMVGHREEQIKMFDEMLALAAGDVVRLIQTNVRRTKMLNELGRSDEAIRAGYAALDLVGELANSRHHAEALEGLGSALSWANRFQKAEAFLRQAIEIYVHLKDTHGESRVRHALGQSLLNRQDPSAGAELEAALVLHKQLKNLNGQAGTTVLLAHFHKAQGEAHLAEPQLREALEISRSIGYRRAEAVCCLNLGNLLCERLNVSQGLELHAQAILIFDAIGDVELGTLTRVNIATMKTRALGDFESAFEQAKSALETYRVMGSIEGEGRALCALGRIHWFQGELETAKTNLEFGLDKIKEVGNHLAEFSASKDLAAIALQMEQINVALEYLEQAEVVAQTYSFSSALPAITALRARAAFQREDLHTALELIQTAFSGLGDDALLEERLLHFEILSDLGQTDEARVVINETHRRLLTVVSELYPDHRYTSLQRVPVHRAIIDAWERTHLEREVVRLPRIGAPTGRPLRDNEFLNITWTRSEPKDDMVSNKSERRKRQLERLLHEAIEQGAAPSVDDLARLLGASRATIKRDIVELRHSGNPVETRRNLIAIQNREIEITRD